MQRTTESSRETDLDTTAPNTSKEPSKSIQSTSVSPRGFQSLPDELLLEIIEHIDHLDVATKLALRCTSRRYYNALSGVVENWTEWPSPRKQGRGTPVRNWLTVNQETARQMLLIERWPYYDSSKLRNHSSDTDESQACVNHSRLEPLDLFFCKSCWKLRPVEKFTTAMTSRSKKSGKMDSLTDKSQDRAYARMCIDCGIMRNEYRGGTILSFGQPELTGNSGQGVVCIACNKFVEVENDSMERLRKTCGDCLAYRPPRTRGTLLKARENDA